MPEPTPYQERREYLALLAEYRRLVEIFGVGRVLVPSRLERLDPSKDGHWCPGAGIGDSDES